MKLVLRVILAFYGLAHTAVVQSYGVPYSPVFTRSIDPIIEEISILQNRDAVLPDKSDLLAWNRYLQMNFLRPSHMDHYDIAQNISDQNQQQMLAIFKNLGMVDDIEPSRKEYDLLFVFGGSLLHTYRRFSYLDWLVRQNKIIIPQTPIYYINGRRSLALVEQEEASSLGVRCLVQDECARLIWEKYFQVLGSLHVMTIDPPSGRRANTEDTLRAFYKTKNLNFFARKSLSSNLEKIKILGFSNQPYVPYQSDLSQTLAFTEKVKVIVEVVGPAAREEMIPTSPHAFDMNLTDTPRSVPSLVYLDSIARRLYILAHLTEEQRDKFLQSSQDSINHR